MHLSEVRELLEREGISFAASWQSQHLHHAIGDRYITAKYPKQGSGNPIDYDEMDIRRAVAGARLRFFMGIPMNSLASRVMEVVTETASKHDRGFAVFADGIATWVAFPEDIDTTGVRSGIIVLPCFIGSLSYDDSATVTEEADED